jgi:hypothetical protein
MFETLSATRVAFEKPAVEFEPRACTGEQAVRMVTELGVIHRLIEGMLAQAAARVADTSAHARAGDRDVAQFYARAVGVDASHARRVISTAKKLERLPEIDAAVRAGRLSGRQAELGVDTVSCNPAAEAALLAAAAEGMVALRDACVVARAWAEDPGERAARHHASRRFRAWTAADGMVEGHFRLAPEVGGPLKTALDAQTQRIFRSRRRAGPHEPLEAYAADALAALVQGERGRRTGTAATVHVVVDHAVLVRGSSLEGEQCEIPGVGPVDVAWVRELLGSAFVTAVVKKGRDITTVAHLGRHIPAELRTAMIAGGRVCDIAGCNGRGYLEIDHSEIDHAKGGPTAWWNLAWRCSVHHRRKTRGWQLGPPGTRTGKRTLHPPGTVLRR